MRQQRKAIGTAFEPRYHSGTVEGIRRRAIAGIMSHSRKRRQQGQDTLDLLYTAMLFKTFPDYEAKTQSLHYVGEDS